ncbi:MAG: asparaginase [Proteobacteria bacterium]|nr:asparaginase [Pseudomonadota bacterium]
MTQLHPMTSNPVLVETWRGDTVESFHRGALAVVDADGALLASLGDIDRPIFPRSAVKALQALPLVASGAADAFGLPDEALAMACASHGGEPEHTQRVAATLAAAGLDADALECGAHWPSHEATALAMKRAGEGICALHNNCSGKHAGFLCFGCMLGGGTGTRDFLRGYVRPEHPVMREVTAALQATTGFDSAQAPRGVDGCSIPTYGIPLRQLALGFARFGSGVGLSTEHALAARRLRLAVARAPFFVAGSGRFDTRVIERLGERVFCKVGAEGVYCAAFPERGLGVALKVDDGGFSRAADVAMAALIESGVALDDDETRFMRQLSETTLSNWNGIAIGRVVATKALRDLELA